MKKWQQDRKKKQHQQIVKRAKPTIKPQAPAKALSQSSNRSSSKLNSTGKVAVDIQQIFDEYAESIYEAKRFNQTPIFKLLKAFNLQQYSKKLAEMGYERQVYPLVLLSDKQKNNVIDQLKVLPGHKAKLLSVIQIIKEIYPRQAVLQSLTKASSHYNNFYYDQSYNNNFKPVKSTAAARGQKQRAGYSSASTDIKKTYNQIDKSARQIFNANLVKEISLKTTKHARKLSSSRSTTSNSGRGNYLHYSSASTASHTSSGSSIHHSHNNSNNNNNNISYNNNSRPQRKVFSSAQLPSSITSGVISNLYPSQNAKKKQKVKHDDIRAMIYPQIQTKDSLKLAISELERYKVQSGGATRVSNAGNQKDQQLLTAPILASSQTKGKKGSKSKKYLTIVNQKQEEYDDFSEPGSSQKMNFKSPGAVKTSNQKKLGGVKEVEEQAKRMPKYGGVINLVENQLPTDSEIMQAEQLRKAMDDQLQIRESQFEQIENIQEETFSNFPYELMDNSASPARKPVQGNASIKNSDGTDETKGTNKNISFQSNKVDVTQFVYQQGGSSQNTSPGKESDNIEEEIQVEKQKSDDDHQQVVEEVQNQEYQKHQDIIKKRIVANKFGASFGHEVKKVQDLVKGDQMCKAFSIALLRHIQFSKGGFHIDDLNMIVDEPDALEFSYNLGNSLLKFRGYKNNSPKQKEQAKVQNNKNFAELQRRLASGSSLNDPSPSTTTTAHSQQGKCRYNNIDDEDEEQVNNQVNKLQQKPELITKKSENDDEVVEEIISCSDANQKSKTKSAKMVMEEIEDENDGEVYDNEQFDNLGDDQQEVKDDQIPIDDGTQDLDFDYTETQLQDFLQSQNLKQTNIRTSSLIESFMKSMNRFSTGSQKNNLSLSRKQSGQRQKFQVGPLPLDPIQSNSQASPEKEHFSPMKRKKSQKRSNNEDKQGKRVKKKRKLDDDDDDDFQRDPQSPTIDLKQNIQEITRQTPLFQINPIQTLQTSQLSQDIINNNMTHNNIEEKSQEPQQLINENDATQLVLDECSNNNNNKNQHQNRPVLHQQNIYNNQNNQTAKFQTSNLLQSQYQMPKDNIKLYLLQTMKIFDENYSYQDQKVMGEYPPQFWGNPTEEELFQYCHYILVVSKMETEIPIIALSYIQRLLMKTGILLNFSNWRKLVLATMMLGSKIWDDDSFENQHFAQVFPEFSLKEINALERTLLELLDYDLMIKGSEYAKFFFLLRTLYDTKYGKHKDLANMILPPKMDKIGQFQKRSFKAGNLLKSQHAKNLDQTM